MEPITHATVGALGAQVIRNPQRDRYLILFSVIAAVLPDIDNFVGMFGHELYLIHHRGITHSFLGGILLALILSGMFKLLVRPFSFRRGFFLSYAMIVGHILLDLFTNYGTQIFQPFTNQRYTVACVFIIDPIFTLTLAYCLYRSVRAPEKRRHYAVWGLIWMFAYPAFNLSVRVALEKYVTMTLNVEGRAFERVHLSPDVLAPIFWKVIVEDATSYDMGGLSSFQPTKPITFTRYAKADRQLLHKFGAHASMFDTYAWFCYYLVMQTETSGDQTILTFGDLRFFSALTFVQNAMRNGNMPFSLRVVVDPRGELIEYSYSEGGRIQVIQRLE